MLSRFLLEDVMPSPRPGLAKKTGLRAGHGLGRKIRLRAGPGLGQKTGLQAGPGPGRALIFVSIVFLIFPKMLKWLPFNYIPRS